MMLSLLAMILSTQVVAAVVDLNFQTVLQNAIPDPDRQTQWAGRFEALMNAAAAFMQFLATPLLLRFLPVGAILLAMPLIQLAVSVAAATRPGLATAAGAYLVFKTFDYSLFKAAKEILYIPLSFDARYRVKELIDVLGYRTAKGATSAALALVAHAGAAAARLYTPVALAGALAWALAAAAVTRAARRLPTGHDPAAANSSTPPSDPAPARR
jgi:ATP/ADP translocase